MVFFLITTADETATTDKITTADETTIADEYTIAEGLDIFRTEDKSTKFYTFYLH